MAVGKGDLLLLDYVARVKETGEVIDVTMESVAKETKVYKEDGIYEPMLVRVGEGWVSKGLDEALVGLDDNEEKEIELLPEKAFGPRDPGKVRILSARDLARRGITPRIGSRIEVDGQFSTVRSVGSGRVVADFNHPLAGKTMLYKVKIIKKLESLTDKVLELIHRRIRKIPKDQFKVQVRQNEVEVELPFQSLALEDFGFATMGIARDITRYLDEIETAKFVLTHVEKKEKLAPAAKKEKPEEQKEAPKAAARPKRPRKSKRELGDKKSKPER